VLSYKAVLAEIKQGSGKKHLLLGNGFSIAAHSKFNYKSLYEEACNADPGLDEFLQSVFDHYGTTNFEQVLRYLYEAAWLAKRYKLKAPPFGRTLLDDYEVVKQALTDVIADIHPPSRDSMADEKVQAACAFICEYDSVFTTNYDLLLYWANLAMKPPPFEDGFLYSEFQEPDDHTGRIHFLHGALHLYTEEGIVRKRKSMPYSVIVSQVKKGLASGQYPIIVTEGSSDEKKKRIEESSYLHWCYRRFSRIHGTLVVFGSSLDEDQDGHLWDAIVRNSNIKTLVVGVHGNGSSISNGKAMLRAKDIRRRRRKMFPGAPLKLLFFNTKNIDVWTPKQKAVAA
jgi:Domain of unknown function (DUF4917)